MMLTAAAEGNLAVVQRLIADGINVDAVYGSTRITALHAASEHGHLDVVQTLLQAGAAVDLRDADQETALAAAAGAHPAVVECLAKAGADVNAKDASDNTPLYVAVYGRCEASARVLVRLGADVNAVESDEGETPLYRAVMNNDRGIVDLLVQAGADVNTRTRILCDTPLHQAETVDIAKRLVDAGADVNAIAGSGPGDTPLSNAAELGFTDVALFLLSSGAVSEPRCPMAAALRERWHQTAVAMVVAGVEVWGSIKQAIDEGVLHGGLPGLGVAIYNVFMRSKFDGLSRLVECMLPEDVARVRAVLLALPLNLPMETRLYIVSQSLDTLHILSRRLFSLVLHV